MTGFTAPEVIDGRFAGWETDATPDRVYVPGTPNGANIDFELRHTEDGRLALPVYSTLADFERCCGPRSPWIAIRADGVDECAALCGADVVVWGASLLAEVPS